MGETKRKVQLMPMEIDEALMRGLNPALVDEEGSIEISEEEELKVRLYRDFREVNSIDPRFYERYDVKRGLRNADGTGVLAGMTNISNVHGYVVSDGEKRYDVKRGLRNADGTGVLAGMTNISNVHGYVVSDGEKLADDGLLRFRGYDLYDLLGDASGERRYRYEEICYLLLMGELPTQSQLDHFVEVIDSQRELPDGFTASMIMRDVPPDIMNVLARSSLLLSSYDEHAEDRTPQHEVHTFTASMIMRDVPPDIMNVLARSILLLYSYDEHAEDRTPQHEVHTALSLISRLPRIMVLTYYSKKARFEHGSMIMHRFIPGQSTAETILSMLRPDRRFTPEEARMLDIMLCLHAEHGGGNNSTFTTRVLSSSDTDPYSAYSARPRKRVCSTSCCACTPSTAAATTRRSRRVFSRPPTPIRTRRIPPPSARSRGSVCSTSCCACTPSTAAATTRRSRRVFSRPPTPIRTRRIPPPSARSRGIATAARTARCAICRLRSSGTSSIGMTMTRLRPTLRRS